MIPAKHLLTSLVQSFSSAILDTVIFLPQPINTDVMVLIYGVGPWFRTPLLCTAQ